MSGICGLVNLSGSSIEAWYLQRLTEAVSRRGPGNVQHRSLQEGYFVHLNLMPAGSSAPPQPLHCQRHEVCLVADARLDNRQELLECLEENAPRAGRNASDAEILLAAYLSWDESCTEHLLGDFAFAVWDKRKRRLLCAVDPLGVKPLHYARVGSLFCFGSDALQVLAHPTLSRSLDESALADYLTGHLEDPGSSFFRGIRSLPPAHRLVATAGGDRTVRYWDIPAAPETCADGSRSPEGTFLEIFRQAVADRLRTPGNVGVAMSGGLDSCSVAAVAHRIAGSSGQRIRACSLVFDLLPDCDERPYIRAMSEELGVEVEPFLADSLWDLEVGPRHNLDSPFPGWPSCYGLMLERLTSLGGGVLLTGHGGDDLFRGSPLVHADRLRQGDLGALSGVLRCARHHRESSWRTFYRLIWQPLFPRIDHVLRRALLRQSPSLAPQWLAPGFVRRTRDAEPRKSRVPDFGSRSLAARQIYDNTLLIPWYRRIVHWHDRNAAAYGIEVRHPFLDRRLFEHVLSIPPALLHEPGSYKPFLRRTMKGVLPEAVRCRPTKTRFRSFLDFVLQERERHRIESLLVDSRSSRLGIINAGELRSAFQRFCEGTAPAEWRGPLWYAVTLELWLRRLENLVGEFELGEAEAEEAAA